MHLHITTHAVYDLSQAMPGLLQIEIGASPLHRIHNEALTLQPELKSEDMRDHFGNRVRRFLAPAGRLDIDYRAVVELHASPPVTLDLLEVEVTDMPPAVLPMLLPSRYCESDRLGDLAFELFGVIPPGAARVHAICDWLRTNLRYEYGHTNSSTAAFDVLSGRVGVCRDFSHLAIAFCRALNIPARYAAGYCLELEPPDFHAYFQAFLATDSGTAGQWYDFDATYKRPRRGLVNIGVGRDAVDTAMTTFFGTANLLEQVVEVKLGI